MNDRRIVIAGGTGLLGSACADLLRSKGYTVQILSRKASNDENTVQWAPSKRTIESNVIDGAFAVINLTGTPLDDKRWTDKFKKVLRQSRIEPAEFLGELINQASTPPEVYVGVAGVAIYGDSGPSPIRESDRSAEASDFIVKLSHDWENAHPRHPDMRSVTIRIGIVMAKESGFLPSVLAPARTGVFAYFGNGRQYMGWIHIEDLARLVVHSIENSEVNGTYNGAAEGKAMKEVMRDVRDAKGAIGIVAPVPGIVASIVLGEMAELLMWSCNPSNEKIIETGFHFKHTDLRSALTDLLH